MFVDHNTWNLKLQRVENSTVRGQSNLIQPFHNARPIDTMKIITGWLMQWEMHDGTDDWRLVRYTSQQTYGLKEIWRLLSSLCVHAVVVGGGFNKPIPVSQKTRRVTDHRAIPLLNLPYSVITLNDGVIEPARGREPLSFPADRIKR
jgi:hypothetical protein